MEESNHLHALNISTFLVTNGENRQTPEQLLCKQKIPNIHRKQLDFVCPFNAHLCREKKIPFVCTCLNKSFPFEVIPTFKILMKKKAG